MIRSIPILGFTLLMLASTVTPRHAHSNVEAWLIYFGIEDVPSWLADKSADTWIFWIAFVGVGVWSTHVYMRSNIAKGKLSVVIGEGEPWVQMSSGIDQARSAQSGGKLYTYRIALVNQHDSTLRNVEVKLASLEKKPQDFHSIGSHLQLRHDRVGTTNVNVYVTKDPQLKDAVFVDVFRFFVSPEGDSFLNVATLPEDASRHIPIDKYELRITATSESGEMAVAEVALIPRPGQIPDFKLLKMRSFPGR